MSLFISHKDSRQYLFLIILYIFITTQGRTQGGGLWSQQHPLGVWREKILWGQILGKVRYLTTICSITFTLWYYYIILFDSSVFLGSGFYNLNFLEIRQDLISKFHVPMIQNWKLSNFLKFLFLILKGRIKNCIHNLLRMSVNYKN